MIRAEDKNTIGIALVFVCMLAVVSSAHGESIRVGLSSVGAAMSTVWVAKEAGYFDKENLATELVYVAGGKAIPALLAGDITFSVSAGNSFLAAVVGGADIVMIAGLINKMPYQIYVTCLCRCYGPVLPVNQRYAELRLQVFNMLRHGRLTDPELCAGSTERAGLIQAPQGL